MNCCRNPLSPEALTVSELTLGLPIEVVKGSGNVVLKGVITNLPEYGSEGWEGATIKTGDEEKPLYIYDNGISRDSKGEWADACAIPLSDVDEVFAG